MEKTRPNTMSWGLGLSDVSEVHPEQVHHFLRQKIREDGHHAGDVQIQQTSRALMKMRKERS